MSYVKSLRFKLMLLGVLPMFLMALIFIFHSVIIASEVKADAANLYIEAATQAGADNTVIQTLQDANVSLGWLAGRWIIFSVIATIVFYIPITMVITKLITPIRQLAKYADSLALGDIQIDVVNDRTDEIGIVQESFSKLVKASREQADLIQRMADGDLTGNYTPRSDADVVGHSLVQMLTRNNEAMSQVLKSAKQLSASTTQIAEGSQSLAQGTTEQASAVEQLSSSIHVITGLTRDSAGKADKAARLAEEIKLNAEKGNQQMAQMMSAVNDINQASQDIGKVIKVIDDIAFQTNILALNAAVEAARAGQHGKGFAVVADEVRSLAVKSAAAAKDTGVLIANSMEKSELGSRIAGETAESLKEIVSGINESNEIVSDIARSSVEQSQGISQIERGISQISQVVQQNSATAEESSAASQEMSEQADMLDEMVAQFKLKDSNKVLPSSSTLRLNS